MSQFAQPLERNPLLLKRVVLGIGQAVHDELDGPQLDPLPGTGRFDQFSGGRDRGTDMQTLHLGLVVGQRTVGNHLETIEAGAVVQLEERESTF